MGNCCSSDNYESSTLNFAHKYNIGTETAETIINRFNYLSDYTDHISTENFLKVFNLITSQAQKNILNVCKASDDGVDIDGFYVLFQPLNPYFANNYIYDIIYSVFSNDNEMFDLKCFFAELKNAYLVQTDSQVQNLMISIKMKSKKTVFLNKEEFMMVFEDKSLNLLQMGKQLIYGSSLFQ